MSQKLKLKVDWREDKVAKLLSVYKNVNVEVTSLPLGDICSENCIVERKDFDDFVNSIVDGRLFSQMQRMFKTDKPSFLIVHGSWQIKRDITDKHVAGAIASCLVRYGCPVLFLICDSKTREFDFFKQAVYIAAKACQKVEEHKFLKPRAVYKYKKHVVPVKVEKVRHLLGVRALVAARLLKEFGSIQGICSASIEQLYGITGIGDASAQRIHKLLH